MKKIISYIFLVVFAFTSFSSGVKADFGTGQLYNFEASLGETVIGRDMAIPAFDYQLELGIPANRLKTPSTIQITKTDELVSLNDLTQASEVFQIILPSENFNSGPYYLTLKSSDSNYHKQIYLFDEEKLTWQPLETKENFFKKIISTTLTSPQVKLVVLENTKILVKGAASWYKYKNGLFAASPDWPKGTKLRVINLDNKKFVDIEVNDYGPNRAQHPERAIDLDAVAFKLLAPLSQGTVNIAIEKITADSSLAKPPSNPEDIAISAKAAVAFNSADKKILWSKELDTVMPLASLTKLVAVKVFLETKPNLNKVVTYSFQDEKLNHNYVLPGESARLRLKDGDRVTVKDLVYASLIGSTNNTVESLVRVSGLKRETFIARMNQRAKEWGAKNTKFIEPTGLSPKNVTTPRDYVIIAREAFLDPIISAVSIKPSYTVTTINTKVKHTFSNTNLIAREKGTEILGSKTGYLVEAGYCLATKWPTDKRKNLIIILFGSPSRQASVDDTKSLLALAIKKLN